MDLKPFKLDIDELINEFAEKKLTTLVDMKGVWLSRKFSFIFEASPTKLVVFMQALYAHSISMSLHSSIDWIFAYNQAFENFIWLSMFK
ncbi:hypothetical protein ACSBR2_005541 [Camellia fascicularis]